MKSVPATSLTLVETHYPNLSVFPKPGGDQEKHCEEKSPAGLTESGPVGRYNSCNIGGLTDGALAKLLDKESKTTT